MGASVNPSDNTTSTNNATTISAYLAWQELNEELSEIAIKAGEDSSQQGDNSVNQTDVNTLVQASNTTTSPSPLDTFTQTAQAQAQAQATSGTNTSGSGT